MSKATCSYFFNKERIKLLKIRITFIDDEKGNKEVLNAIENLKDKYTIINQSNIYRGRGSSKYSNIYLDLEENKQS